ncbi:MAG: P-loop NTPase fold protein [Clostridium perfringens]|uniref:KAP family P-loop NTPase fold protein n=1 Tax=Clostridium perfringens TaxID=1502 RepID=UPI000F5398ED|nr:P-loop NTPase fold protein [Clostridium perfringens]ELC8341485.1 NTPase KAP [Clostridium perfringens]MBO3387963.1 NTPase KAP [Clostridium perfringens]MBO3413420.1 NTPase KAP [Clostridium perfringens]MDK0836027.1 P-loop NTPase fold protein [Clostridium perfringens]MDU3645604.1 P-loop NTPase fold protein [Clostridium perfringens]
MSIKCDNAIKSKEEDLLGRKRFAINIAENIIDYRNNEAITIGLIGKWGSGKSSVINMMKEHITKEEKEIEFIDFNPWYFSGGNKLIEEFFGVLIYYLGIENNELNKLGEHLKLYSLIIKPFSFIPTVGKLAEGLYGVTKYSSEAISEFCKQEKTDINSLKESINKELKSLNKKIVITIDDIDRLENDEVKDIFKLVRAVGDFNNIIYVLAFDEDKVCNVFSSGPDYIDKIINIPICIPDVSKRAINNYFLGKLNENFKLDNSNWSYWKKIYNKFLENKFENFRDVNRFLNVLIFNKKGILKEVNIVDYIIITFLKLFDKEVYLFIKDNKNLLLKDGFEEKISQCIEELNYGKKRTLEINNLIKTMFRKSVNKNLRSINRSAYFNTYFEEILMDEVYSSDDLKCYKAMSSKNELIVYLKDIDKKELLKIFNNIEEIIQRLNKEQKYFFEEVLREKIVLLNKDSQTNFNSKNEQEFAFRELKKLLNELDDYERVFKSIDIEDEGYDVLALMDYIAFIKNKFGKEFDKKTLNNIKKYIYSIKYEKDMYNLFGILKNIGINVEEYIKHIISDDEGLIVYLKSTDEIIDIHSECSYDENGEPYDCDIIENRLIILENITDFISYDYVKERVDSLSESFKENNKDIIREFEYYLGRADFYENLYGDVIEEID